MNQSRGSFVDVDELMRRVSLDDVCRFYGVPLDAIHRVGDEVRTRCFLNCGKNEPTGDRVLALKTDDVKRWCCHRYECSHKAGGNLVGLIDLVKPGEHMDGRPRGERFKAILTDLQQIAGGSPPPVRAADPAKRESAATEPPKSNVPLAESENERARGLVALQEKFVVDTATMNPAAASYFRTRPYLTPEVCRQWQVGYLPSNAGGDAAGGTMRGKIVYPIHNEAGQVLTWFGRDPDYEAKHAAWSRGNRDDREPQKVHFVKGFHRGLELFAQQRFATADVREAVQALRHLLVVEGPNDVIRLGALGVPAFAVCSNRITREQAEKVGRWCRELGVAAALLFDLDAEGETGAQQAVVELAQHCPVRFGWSRAMHAGRFAGRQPENLNDDEWPLLAERLLA